jgi:hypothetical protein
MEPTQVTPFSYVSDKSVIDIDKHSSLLGEELIHAAKGFIVLTLGVNLIKHFCFQFMLPTGNTKGGSITGPLTSCLTGLESVVRQLTIFVFIFKTD